MDGFGHGKIHDGDGISDCITYETLKLIDIIYIILMYIYNFEINSKDPQSSSDGLIKFGIKIHLQCCEMQVQLNKKLHPPISL